MSFTYSYQSTLIESARVYDNILKKVGEIQSVKYYDRVTYINVYLVLGLIKIMI